MGSGSFEQDVFQITILSTAFGAIIVFSRAIRFWGIWVLPPIIGTLSILLLAEPGQQGYVGEYFNLHHQALLTLGHIATGAALGYAALVPGAIVLLIMRQFISVLKPSEWETGDGQPVAAHELAPRDLARRVFVSVAAATGAIVGVLCTTDVLWKAVESALNPRALAAVVFVTAAIVVLAGPFKDYVLRGADDEKGGFEEHLTAAISTRTIGRFFLVGMMVLALEFAYNCVGNTIEAADAGLLSLLIVAGVTPSIVSCYWSAAIQLSMQPMHHLWFPATIAGGLLNLGPGLLFAASAVSEDSKRPGLELAVGSLIVGLIIGFFVCGLYAMLGGYALEKFKGRNALVALGVAIFLGSAVHMGIMLAIYSMMSIPVLPSFYWTFLAINAGWVFGLYTSGFPRLVFAMTKTGEAGR